jgi:hypothetical protein
MERITGNTNADPQSISLPVVPVIPPQVAPGEVIRAGHENQTTQALADLWTDVQALGLGAVPSTRKVIAGAGLSGGGDLTADRTFTAIPATVAALGSVKVGTGIAVAGDGTITVNSAAIAGGIQTPWLQDVSGGGHSLSTVQNITATGQIMCTSFAASGSANAASYAVSSYSFAYLASAGKIAVTCDTLTATGAVSAAVVNVASTLFAKFSAGTNIAVTCDTVKATTSVNIGAFVSAGVALSVCTTNVTTPATATQFRICEQTANPTYGLNIGFYLDSVAGSYKGVIQGNTGSPIGPLLLNPLGGPVGVGISSPLGAFHVSGASGLGIFSGTINPQIRIDDATTATSCFLAISSGVSSYLNGSIAKDALLWSNGGGVGIGTGGSMRMYVNALGNVGIGTNLPNGSLHIVTFNTAGVNGTAPLVLDRTYGDVGDYQDIVFGAGGGNAPNRAAIIRSVAVGGGEGGLAFYTQTASGDAANHQSVMILGNGNVGIGTSTPAVKLDIVSNDSSDTGGAIRIVPSNQSQSATYSFGGITSSFYFKIQASGAQFISLNPAGGKVCHASRSTRRLR